VGLDTGAVEGRCIADRIVGALAPTRADHQHGTWGLAGPDENVRGAGGAVQQVPLPQQLLAPIDDRDAFSVVHKEVLLVSEW
jgi:hypothetical protein